MRRGLLQAIDEHRKKLNGPHHIFSTENPVNTPELKMSHNQVLKHLRAAGYDSHTVQGHYGAPEKSIITYGVNADQAENLHQLAGRLGQHSSLHSDGTNHELRFHHGTAKGKRLKGQNTTWHTQKPSTNFTALPGGLHHFAHQFGQEDDDLEKSEPNQAVQSVANSYAQAKGLKVETGTGAKVNPDFSTKVAGAYQEMKHDPSHPDVKAAYGALINETKDQFHHMTKAGLKISKIKAGQDNPYKSSKDLHEDIRQNNHLWYFPTESGFGSDSSAPKDHPMLQPTGVHHDGHELLANDMFRVVHDYFGHAKGGHTFSANGEESAYQDHAQMYSPLARKALTTETRAQNSWVNYGPHAAHNKANPQKTIFADQKAGLMPDWTMNDPHAPIQKSEPDDDYSFKSKKHKNGRGISVSAYHKEKLVGGASFTHGPEGFTEAGFLPTDSDYPKHDEITPLHVEIDDTHRRKGLASKMYQIAEKSTGKKIRRSPQKTPASDALWAQPNRKFGKTERMMLTLIKAANDDEYKKFASKGMALMYPVTINGARANPHNGIDYHHTVKVFDTSKDSADQAHEIAQKTPLKPPSSKHVGIEPITLTGKGGYTVYALELTGPHTHEMREHNSRFDHMGFNETYEYKPHISVDKETWEKTRDAGHKTAHDAGIRFGQAELRQGQNILARYPHRDESASTEAIQAVREKAQSSARPKVAAFKKSEPLEKGLMRGLATTAASAATIAGCALAPHNASPDAGSHEIQATHHVDPYDRVKMLDAIAQVESSGGKNLNHPTTASGSKAFGKYALMPGTIRETIHLNKDLEEHKKALGLDDQKLVGYLNKHPGLEETLASHHLARLEAHFGHDKETLGFAWNHGIVGTNRALKEKSNIKSHPYVMKVRDAYRSKT